MISALYTLMKRALSIRGPFVDKTRVEWAARGPRSASRTLGVESRGRESHYTHVCGERTKQATYSLRFYWTRCIISSRVFVVYIQSCASYLFEKYSNKFLLFSHRKVTRVFFYWCRCCFIVLLFTFFFLWK